MTVDAGSSSRPLVSIIIPKHDQGKFRRNALDSALGRDYRHLEVIVCGGGSNDETVAIVEEYGTRWPELRSWSERDRGVADAVKKGFERASAVTAGIRSSDGVCLCGAVSTPGELFVVRPEPGLVYGEG